MKKQKVNIKNRAIWDKTNGRCWFCGVRLLKPRPNHHDDVQRKRWYTLDHATPRSRGGSNDNDNLLPSCNKCNSDKCDMTVEEYRYHMIMRRNHIPSFTEEQRAYLTSIGVDIFNGITYKFWGER